LEIVCHLGGVAEVGWVVGEGVVAAVADEIGVVGHATEAVGIAARELLAEQFV
jgi:hypothetical protein